MTEEKISWEKVKILLYLVMLLIGLLGGKGIGKLRANKEIKKLGKEIEALQKNLEMFYPPLPEEIKSISGEIKKVEKNALEVETVMRVSRFPLPEGKEIEKQIKKVKIEKETKIVKIDWGMPIPPETPKPKETVLKVEDLKVGDRVIITSEENIKDKKEFKASRVELVTIP